LGNFKYMASLSNTCGQKQFPYTPAPFEDADGIEEPMRPLLPPDYRPTEDEPFMSPLQAEYFRQKLLAWRSELLQESSETLHHLQEESLAEPDIADRASLETDFAGTAHPRP